MKTYHSPGLKKVKSDSIEDAAWQFAYMRAKASRSAWKGASRPIKHPTLEGFWISTITANKDNKTLVYKVAEVVKKRKTQKPLVGWAKPGWVGLRGKAAMKL